MSNSFKDFFRHFFRSYRNGPIRIGHSFIRRLGDGLLAQQQEVRLRSGLKLRLDLSKGIQNSIFWFDGDIDILLYWAIRELVPLGGVFVDCGANCGLMGLLARQYRMARVVFIEPHPRLSESIAANIRLNDFGSTCESLQVVASDTRGEIIFHEDLKRDGSHAIQPDPERKQDYLSLGPTPCLTLADVIETKALGKIHFLKIDTEGNDYAVLKGLGSYLQPAFVEIVYVEMFSDRQPICDLLRSKGYVGFASAPLKRRRIVQLQHRYEQGGRVTYFEPLNETQPFSGDVLWCGKDSPTANYLTELHRSASTCGR